MPYWKCRSCHHEWEALNKEVCDWCDSDKPIMLEKKTPLEKMLEDPEWRRKIKKGMT